MIPQELLKHIDALWCGREIPDDFMDIVIEINNRVENAEGNHMLRSTQVLALIQWLYDKKIIGTFVNGE